MDINKLFSDKSESKKDKPAVKMAFPDSLSSLPLVFALMNRLIQHPFDTHIVSPPKIEKKMLNGEAEIALIPVQTLAKTKEIWRIVPALSVAAFGKMKSVNLFFKSGLRKIRKIAVDSNAGAGFYLLQIIINEKYQISPEYIFMQPDMNMMLKDCDAALITGLPALQAGQTKENYLDLNEQWSDLTGLPMVYELWAGREMTVTQNHADILKSAYEIGKLNLEKIAKITEEKQKFSWAIYHDYLTHNLIYEFAENEKAGLLEFFHYAFSYSLIDYIPDLHFFSS